ncbi:MULTISPECIES: type VI secretion system-associated protein TagF [Chromobacterium]|uniref:Type VI secretion system-associated protein TagF n=3 Tax=Chromobacterium TaxID=535 RepID=A0ABS3GTS1_9NEIS|nr:MULTISPECIES: type VI secretion system-associated protein TagF [Chromobacterium]AXT45184.1 type VI secretion system-associated protein TagF [Chromobacterium rhizoryzae]MBK0417357.1 type VI secretion system-associated protein TagF [Chromobacterium haemolyticum]MBO0418458.1 type VI secretion system-associated protein TagF [Chromobacterium haemolyticum]MBO0501806.1 type VI secretion system-associated protein TagF [Chromobacterium haemolyticum]MDH0344590.1 type VI secretion system-associated pr
MAFNFKRAQETPPQFCIFGKLPRRGDFVRVNATHPAATQLDQLLAQSLGGLEAGPEAVERYRAMPGTSFVLRSRDQMWLSLGVMQPSRDESGRNYPLVAASLMPCDAALPPLSVLMLANELFFSGLKEQLSSAIDNAVEMLACRQFLEEQSLFGISSVADLELAQQLLERHLSVTPASHLGRLLSGRGLPDLETVLLAFTFHHQLLRKFQGSLTAQTYLLPLPDSDGEDMLAAATWLSLYQAATAGQAGQAEQCLLIQRPEGRFLALLPGDLNEQIVAQCWGGQLDARFIVDVAEPQAPWRSHQAYAEAAYILGRRLNDPSISVAQLREVASSLSRSVA